MSRSASATAPVALSSDCVTRRFVPLFWRLFVPNATVLGVACVVLMVEPANGRIIALVGGLTVMLTANLMLMRSATAPLSRLTNLMRRVDPLRPGQRVPPPAQQSELAVLAEAFNDMLDRLEDERREAGRRALSERETERRRLAAELHDEIGQSLTALALELDRLRSRAPQDLQGDVAHARDTALRTVDDVRSLVKQLRPEALDALGLVPAVASLIERVSASTGLRIARHLDRDLPQLSPEAELVLYRVLQESLTNVVRHAGTDAADVTLRTIDGRVVLTVSDDGVGITESEEESNGIRGMRERAMLIGADLSVESGPDAGTCVRLELTSGS